MTINGKTYFNTLRRLNLKLIPISKKIKQKIKGLKTVETRTILNKFSKADRKQDYSILYGGRYNLSYCNLSARKIK
jgi:hypothetical protein